VAALQRTTVLAAISRTTPILYVSFYVDRQRQTEVIKIMASLGYVPKDNLFVHPINQFTVDFPKGPIGIGPEIISDWDTIYRKKELLHIVTPTDAVRDRLAKYYFWNDSSALEAAKAVFRRQRSRVDLKEVRRWSEVEGETAKFEDFRRQVMHRAQRRTQKH
jgi:hypothetical protein